MKKRGGDEEEYKPARSLKKRKSDQFKLAQQQVLLKDLINSKLLSVGQRIYVKDQEAEITEEGTIKVFSNGQYYEYKNPTSWTRQATGRESGGWQQIRLKPSNELLSTIKEKYLQNLMEGDYDNISESNAAEEEHFASPEDVELPLNVRFACDEARPFQITWVSPDFQEFHFEYQGKSYTSLHEFGQKIYDDMKNSNPPTNNNFSFNSLVYEIEGKWMDAEKIIEEDKTRHKHDSNNNTAATTTTTTTPTKNTNDNNDGTNNNANNTKNTNDNKAPGGITSPNNTPPPIITPTTSPGKPEGGQYKILLIVDGEDDVPVRVNSAASTLEELLAIIVEESNLGVADPSNFDIKLWDHEFETYTRFPNRLANVPTKCKISIKRLSKPQTKVESATAASPVEPSISAPQAPTPSVTAAATTPVHNESSVSTTETTIAPTAPPADVVPDVAPDRMEVDTPVPSVVSPTPTPTPIPTPTQSEQSAPVESEVKNK